QQLTPSTFSVKAASGRTPVVSSHPSRPSFDEDREILDILLEEAPRSYATAKKLALRRDDFRCMLTRRLDLGSVVQFPWLRDRGKKEKTVESPTHCAHIIPEFINQQISSSEHKTDDATSICAVLDRFGQVQFDKELNGAGINRLENILTLESSLHTYFDCLSIWFEETDAPNQYHIRAVRESIVPLLPKIVTLSSTDARLPLPDPRYLRLHAACAQVAHFSGAAEYIDSIFRDVEEMRVLSKDGSSIDVLTYALMRQGVVV
ncbi:hypothetical protein AN958_10006, partial [Leucoagaricus sp. SymC.cos]